MEKPDREDIMTVLGIVVFGMFFGTMLYLWWIGV